MRSYVIVWDSGPQTPYLGVWEPEPISQKKTAKWEPYQPLKNLAFNLAGLYIIRNDTIEATILLVGFCLPNI
jgi:hypothetical protein